MIIADGNMYKVQNGVELLYAQCGYAQSIEHSREVVKPVKCYLLNTLEAYMSLFLCHAELVV